MTIRNKELIGVISSSSCPVGLLFTDYELP